MARIKLTKNELKKQRSDLARCSRYLPTLELKKTQLIQEMQRVQDTIDALEQEIERVQGEALPWVGVFAEEVDWPGLLEVVGVEIGQDNVAGIELPVFVRVEFAVHPYDLRCTPLWVDKGLEIVRAQIGRRAAVQVGHRQRHILGEELRTTIQRIKLLEEVKIPTARRHIRKIRIFLGDQQTAAVVRSKIAKAKIDAGKEKAA
ncbi:MAG: V-type ATP synthase subunit D [Candidatus Latescibacteria bacterium]|nr:V-type ATP synthase subunit D [Candidatus Latescibacterota bacterium]